MALRPKSPSSLSNNDSPSSLPSSSPVSVQWEDAPTELTRRCAMVEIFGETDTGRTTLALTAPGPIAYIHAHEKVEGVLQIQRKLGKEIKVKKFGGMLRGSVDEMQKQATEQMNILEAAYYDAYGWARSVLLDTHTEAWQIYQIAHLGTLTREGRSERDQKKGQLVYAEINAKWLSLLKAFRVHAEAENRTNLILIGQVKDEYKKIDGKNQTTGKKLSAGQKGTPLACDVRLQTRLRKSAGEYTFSAEIIKPWWNGAMRGESLEGDLMSLPLILSLITETSQEEWSD